MEIVLSVASSQRVKEGESERVWLHMPQKVCLLEAEGAVGGKTWDRDLTELGRESIVSMSVMHYGAPPQTRKLLGNFWDWASQYGTKKSTCSASNFLQMLEESREIIYRLYPLNLQPVIKNYYWSNKNWSYIWMQVSCKVPLKFIINYILYPSLKKWSILRMDILQVDSLKAWLGLNHK